MSIEISKTDENLNILYYLWFRLISYHFDSFILCPNALAQDNVS